MFLFLFETLLEFVCRFHLIVSCGMVSFTFFLSIVVKLNANRMVVGTLRGFDQFMNLVVDNTVEVNGDDKTDIGMVVRVPLSLL